MTRQQIEAENALLRELVTQYQLVAWLRFTSAGETMRLACLRLKELERWAALRDIGFAARHAPHERELPAAETFLSCSCGDRLAIAGEQTAVAAGSGYFKVLHGGKRCRVDEKDVAA